MPQAERLDALITRVAAVSGGRPQIAEDTAEKLLMKLEAGEIDIVVGEFDATSPWTRRVHLIPPLARAPHAGAEIEITAAARNGENAWIMLLEREARALAEGR